MQTRQEIESRLAELRQQRGIASPDGKKFDSSMIDKAEGGLASLDDAEAERIRRQRKQDARDATANRRARIVRLAEIEQQRLAAWSILEGTARKLVEAIRTVVDVTESERVIAGEIAPPVPSALGPYEMRHRVFGRLVEILARARVGFERTAGVSGIYSRLVDWKQIEHEALASYIQKLEDENDKN